MFLNRYWVLFYSFVLMSMLTGCDSKSPIQRYRVPKSNLEMKSKLIERPQLKWKLPQGWNEEAISGMRLASFSIQKNDHLLDCSIVKLIGEGGGVASNVNRWREQVGLDPLKNEIDILDQAQTLEAPIGKFLYFKIINDVNESNSILAAIYAQEHEVYFVKLMGLTGSVLSEENFFLNFCQSLEFSKE